MIAMYSSQILFGIWLLRLRNQAGLSQPELARRVGLRLGRKFAHSNIAGWELGSGFGNQTVIPALASELGVTVEDLLKVEATAKGYVERTDDNLPPKRF